MSENKTNGSMPLPPSAPGTSPVSQPLSSAPPSFGSPSPTHQGFSPGQASPNSGFSGPQNNNEFEIDEEGYTIFPKESFLDIQTPPTNINKWLNENADFIPCKSVFGNKKISYDLFLAELSYDLFDLVLKTNLLKSKPIITKIKKQLTFILISVKQLPDLDRDLIFNTTLRFVDFLKTVIYYPEVEKMDDEVIAYLPILKETAMAFKSFLLKNR